MCVPVVGGGGPPASTSRPAPRPFAKGIPMYSAFLAAVLPAVFTGQVYRCSGGGYYANGGGYGFNYGGFAPQSYSAPRRFVRFEVGFGNGRRLSLAYDGGFRPGWGGGYQPFQALPAG